MNKRIVKIFIILLCISALFPSCASTKAVKPVYLTDEKAISLLDLSAVGTPIDSYQLMTGSFEDHKDFTAEVLLKADSEILALVIIAPTGQTIAEISYDGQRANLESSFIPASSFRPEYILADIQLAYYSTEAIKTELLSKGLDFRYGKDKNGTYREILDNDKIIWRSNLKDSHMSVINYLRKYNYELEIL